MLPGSRPLTGLSGLQPYGGGPVAIPLRGYVVCNPSSQLEDVAIPWVMVCNSHFTKIRCRNPLTGLCGLQRELRGVDGPGDEAGGRNPLTGLCGLQQISEAIEAAKTLRVAIPLRGYVVCNAGSGGGPRHLEDPSQSPYGAMWFATLPP
jgi:hypothetical protein